MELLKCILVLVCVFLAIVSCRAAKKGGRIFNGELDEIKTVPHLVRLHNASEQICAGSIVASDKILTSAHCVVGQDQKRLKIVAGTSFLDHGGIERVVTKAFVAPDYNGETMQNDYAVLKLNATLEGENIKAIELCTSSTSAPVGTVGLVTGWGHTEYDTKSNQLRSVELSLIPIDECVQKYAKVTPIDPKTMICAAEFLKDACKYDSGDSLVINGTLHGVVSGGLGCADPDFPGIYLNVCALHESIQKLIDDAN